LNKAQPAAAVDVDNEIRTAPLRVLVVEDEALVSLFLTEVLSDLGYQVAGCAVSLRGALILAASTPADIALVDIGLAGEGDGIDVAIELRKRYGLPALLMTGAPQAALAMRVAQAQPLGYLLKPYTELDVERALAAAAVQIRCNSSDSVSGASQDDRQPPTGGTIRPRQ
jgi:DNA-binding NarL/FixJ family response regulator